MSIIGKIKSKLRRRTYQETFTELKDQLRTAGMSGKDAEDVAGMLAWAAHKKSFSDVFLKHSSEFLRFCEALRKNNVDWHRLRQWMDRAMDIAEGKQ